MPAREPVEGSFFRQTHPRRRQALACKNSVSRNGLLLHTNRSRPAVAVADLAGTRLAALLQSGLAAADPCAHVRGRGAVSLFSRRNHPAKARSTGPREWGYDYVAINRALEEAFARCAIDRSRLAIGGFSDGASCALSLGLANGDVFRPASSHFPRVLSLGLRLVEDKGPRAWKYPLVYIAHGSADNVLPIVASTSRVFVSSLRKNGYNCRSFANSAEAIISRARLPIRR